MVKGTQDIDFGKMPITEMTVTPVVRKVIKNQVKGKQ